MKPYLRALRVYNFKAIRFTGTLRLGPLTVLIGNNGVGKSSLIDALRTYRTFCTADLTEAVDLWRGFNFARNMRAIGSRDSVAQSQPALQTGPIRFEFGFNYPSGTMESRAQLNRVGDRVYVQREYIKSKTVGVDYRAPAGRKGQRQRSWMRDDDFAGAYLADIEGWQYLDLDPKAIGQPRRYYRREGRVALEPGGANLADCLLNLMDRAPEAFERLIEVMGYVLGYMQDVRPRVDEGLEKAVLLELVESAGKGKTFRVPGWLLSSGTLRVLALAYLLVDPEPPKLLLIEEIENGLDPRTIGLIVDLVREATSAGRTQIIATSHSPYLLDLLELEDILLCERDKEGLATFYRVDEDAALAKWREDFQPGKLYTMGRLQYSSKPESSKPEQVREPEAPDGGWK